MQLGHYSGGWRLKEELNSFTKIIKSLLYCISLASHIEL